jgi:hypothetical integral membrane protein (TIGR02206 family)
MSTFVLWEGSHQAVLLLTALTVLSMVWVRQLGKQQQRCVRLAIAITLISHVLGYHLWHLHHYSWNIKFALPLQISWVSNYLTIASLLTRNNRLFQITYYLGTWSALAAMVLPALSRDFPSFDFFDFFISHAFILIGIAYICLVERVQMTYQNLWISFAILCVVSLLAYLVNQSTGANYMFLAGIPNTENFLPASPYHLPIVVIAILICLHLQYLPYCRNRNAKTRFIP